MKKTTFLICSMLSLMVWALTSCTADKLPEVVDNSTLCDSVGVTYDDHIKGIFDRGCNYSGCHDGNNQMGLATFGSMSASRRDYAHSRVQNGSMPPSYASYQLTKAERDTVDCWEKSGYLKD